MIGVEEGRIYPRFTAGEHARRVALVRDLIGSLELDGLVIFGWSAQNRTAQADVYYLTEYLGMRDNYVVFPRGGDPVFFVQSYNHVPNARVVSVVDDVRWGGVDNGDAVGRELERQGLRKVGVVGWMPYQHHAAMIAAAPGAGFVDVTARYRRLRLVKSPEELTWLRRGAELSDSALAGLARGLAEPGVREFELAAYIEAEYLKEGGQTGFYYISSTSMSEPDRSVPAQVLSARTIEVGDIVSCEVSIAHAGYAGQGLRTFAVGADPTAVISDMHDLAEAVYAAVADVLRPGATMEDVWAASDGIAESGFTIRDSLAHGYGIGLLPPDVRTRETTHGRNDDWVFEENQTLVIQPNVVSLDETVGVQTGDLCVVTAEGARSLHAFPLELIRVDRPPTP